MIAKALNFLNKKKEPDFVYKGHTWQEYKKQLLDLRALKPDSEQEFVRVELEMRTIEIYMRSMEYLAKY